MVSQVDLVGDYLEAHNRHDVDGTLANLNEGVRFVMPGVWTKTGIAEIRALAEALDVSGGVEQARPAQHPPKSIYLR